MAIDAASRRPTAPPVPQRRAGVAAAALGLLATSLLCGALAAGLAERAFGLAGGSAVLTIDALVELVVTGVGTLVAAWLAGTAVLALGCLAVRLLGSTWRLGEGLVHRCAPAVVRRSLALVVGATVGLGATTGASAAVSTPTPTPSATSAVTVTVDDLGWVVTTPPLPTGTTATAQARGADTGGAPELGEPSPTVAPGPAAEPSTVTSSAAVVAPVTTPATPSRPARAAAPSPGPDDAGRVVVAAGDSLWAIAAHHLAPDATDAEIAASWPQWYRANSDVIGTDPGLIVPGQQLTAPVEQDGAAS